MVLQLTCIVCILQHKLHLNRGLTRSGERLRAGQGRAGQGRAGQGRAGQGRAGQGRAGQILTCSFARVAYFSDSPITSSASCSGSLLNSRDSG
jgi:hypothetical protein